MPGPDLRVDPDEVREKGWPALFAGDLARPFPMVVEIGFGRGEFLWNLALEHPGVAHVGVDVSFKRVLKMARRLARTAIRNVRLVEATGEEMVRELLPESCVGTFWINFPDPWPKRRHHRRRLIQPPFLRDLALRLEPGGRVELATDHPGYAEWIDALLRAEPLLENAHAPKPFLRKVPGRLQTAYQLEWLREGRSLCFWSYRRRSGSRGEAASPADPVGRGPISKGP